MWEGYDAEYYYYPNTADVPIYQQIVSQIRDAILRGELTEGAAAAIHPIPREGSAHQRHHDQARLRRSRTGEGYIVSVSGKGSYVAERNPEMLYESRLNYRRKQNWKTLSGTAKSLDIGRDDVNRLLELLYEEDETL